MYVNTEWQSYKCQNLSQEQLRKTLIKLDVYNACSDWSKPVFGSGHPNTEIIN